MDSPIWLQYAEFVRRRSAAVCRVIEIIRQPFFSCYTLQANEYEKEKDNVGNEGNKNIKLLSQVPAPQDCTDADWS